MPGRFSKGTFDHDGDGKPGGSLSRAAAEEKAMAKKPTSTEDTPKDGEGAAAAKPAPSQPWAKGDASEDSAKATTGEGDAPAADAASENPPVPSAEELAALAAEQAQAQRERANELLEGLSEDERAEFEAFISQQALAKLELMHRIRAAREIEVNLVDDANHYGNQIPVPRNKELEA